MHRRTFLYGLVPLPWAGHLTAAQQPEPHFIPTDQLKKMAKSKKSFLLDVREPKELQELGTLKGAKNIPMGEVEKRLAEVPKDKKVVLL
jgi:rhodanese-related sulfurtransferase